MKKREPSSEALLLLGKVPDVVVARVDGVSISPVRRWREERGIAAFNEKKMRKVVKDKKADLEERHPGLFDRLGKETDISLAREYDLSRERIRQIRNRLGIQVYEPPCKVPIHLLGTMTDKELARKFRVSTFTIRKLRKLHGIPIYSDPDRRSKLDSIRDLLGKKSDYEIARETGLHSGCVFLERRRLGIKPHTPDPKRSLLDRSKITRLFHEGKSDAEIAKSVGSKSRHVISSIRTKELGLFRRRPVKSPAETCWLEIDPLIGTKSDAAIGRQFHIPALDVSARRRHLGIQPYKR